MKNLILVFILSAAFFANANSDINANKLNYRFNDRSNSLPLAFSPDSKYIAGGFYDGSIKLWDITKAEWVKTFRGHTEQVNSVVFVSNGEHIITSSDDKLIKVWDIKSGECVKTLSGHKYGITCISINPDGNKLLSASGYADGEVKLWDISSGNCIYTIKHSPGAAPKSVAFSPDGKSFVVGGVNHKLVIYSSDEGKVTLSIDTRNRIQSLVFSKNGDCVVTVNNMGQVFEWDIKKQIQSYNVYISKAEANIHSNIVRCPNNSSYAFSSFNSIRTIGVSDHVYEFPLEKQLKNTVCFSVAYSNDGKMLAASTSDSTIAIWMVNSTLKYSSGIPHTVIKLETGYFKIESNSTSKQDIPFDILENSLTFTDSDSNNIIEPGDRCQIHFSAVNYLPQDIYKLVKIATVTGNTKGIILKDVYAVNIEKGKTGTFVFSFTVKDNAPIETGFVEITLYLEGWVGGNAHKKYTTTGRSIKVPTRTKQ